VACGQASDLHHHHLIPRVLGGSDDETNLITLCVECHGKMHGVEWKLGLGELIKAGVERAKPKRLARRAERLKEAEAENQLFEARSGPNRSSCWE
jgi:5-methylcytosine-specific restriction endonuclease McrA